MFSSTVPEVPWRAIVRTPSPTRSYHKNEKGLIALKDVSHTYLWPILKGIARRVLCSQRFIYNRRAFDGRYHTSYYLIFRYHIIRLLSLKNDSNLRQLHYTV